MQMQAAILTEPNTPFRIETVTLDLYHAGRLKLEEMITRRYRLNEINDAYADLLSGALARAIIVY